jgi:hypothetical protein
VFSEYFDEFIIYLPINIEEKLILLGRIKNLNKNNGIEIITNPAL